jgi:hypothetical protein
MSRGTAACHCAFGSNEENYAHIYMRRARVGGVDVTILECKVHKGRNHL